jgi:hypothetical protein
MTTLDGSEVGVNVEELDIQTLADEGMKLLRLEINDLYAILGGQLLARNLPTRVAGIVSYLSMVRSASLAKCFYGNQLFEPSVTEWGAGAGVIYDDLKQDGMGFLSERSKDLRKALCNEDFLRLTEDVNRSTMRIVVMIVGATLKMPQEFDSVSVSLSAILFKQGLRSFCSETKEGDGDIHRD